MKILMSVCISLAFFFSPHVLLAASPKETVQTRIDEILNVLKDPALKGDGAVGVKEEKVWNILDNVFDYRQLSKQALGRNWKEINAEQQDEFTVVFSRFIGKTYMKKVVSYADEKIDVNQEIMLDEETAEVRTILFSKNNEIPINYRLVTSDGQWRAFDVVIEGVSLVNNYRSQFNQFLRKKSITQLLKTLEVKVNKEE